MRGASRRVRGVSLLELLVVATLGAIVTAGATSAFTSAISFQERVVPEREAQLERQRFEDGLTRLLRAAYLANDAQDTTTYLVAGSSSGDGGLSDTASADTLILTIQGLPPSATLMNSGEDFETRNEVFGPQGGTAEIQISTSPVGEAGDREGLFLREQRPADGDPYQGGYESLLHSRVSFMEFEFWNGEAWQGEWDSINQGERRLPAAIRVTYAFFDEEESPRTFVVRVPLSDVTPENPLGVGVEP